MRGIGANIKKAREMRGLKQSDLAALVGVTPSSIANYEANTSHPKEPVLYKLIEALQVDANYLFEGAVKQKSESSPLNTWYTPLADAYLSAAKKTRQAACDVLDIDYVDPGEVEGLKTTLRRFKYKATAGAFSYVEDDSSEDVEYPASKVPQGTSFAVQLAGDSMAPTIPDGVDLFVKSQRELRNNEIGVFIVDHMAVCKRFVRDGSNILLVSDNPQHNPIRIASDEEYFGVVGKVLGWTSV